MLFSLKTKKLASFNTPILYFINANQIILCKMASTNISNTRLTLSIIILALPLLWIFFLYHLRTWPGVVIMRNSVIGPYLGQAMNNKLLSAKQTIPRNWYGSQILQQRLHILKSKVTSGISSDPIELSTYSLGFQGVGKCLAPYIKPEGVAK